MTYSQEVINIGASPNDGNGDPLRVAFDKINNNFSSLFTTFVNSTVSTTTGGDQGQVVFEYPVAEFTQGQFYIQSKDPTSADSQTVTLSAQVNNAGDAVTFTGYGSTFFGNAIARYDMDVNSGNIRILVNPLTTDNMTHAISSQIMWANQ